jgi:hypothetical protein
MVPIIAFPAACSLMIGELPEPMSGVGPLAGDGGDRGAGGDGAISSGAAGGMDSTGNGGSPSGGDPFGSGGVRSTGAAGNAGEPGLLPETGAAGAAGGSSVTDICDRDGDQFRAQTACGGDDCDDTDAQVAPDQLAYFASRQANVDFDYNCDGSAEQEQTAAVVCSGLSLGACATEVEGFLGSLPPCGDVGPWGRCTKTPPLNTCDKMVIDAQRRMRCR